MFRLCGFFFTGFLTILLGAQVSVKAQYKGSASISGRVTIAGEPGKGLTVTATLNNQTTSHSARRGHHRTHYKFRREADDRGASVS
jgi:hypothetical protein